MKLVCLNVAIFETNNDKLNTFLKKQSADFLALQEVTKRTDEQAFEKYVSIDTINQVTTELKYRFFAPNWIQNDFEIPNFHGVDLFKYDLGGFIESGNYIKSKFKISSAKNIFVQNYFALITDWSEWPKQDYKAIQAVDIELPEGKKFRIINYH